MNELLKAAEHACALAQRLGADECAVAISRSRGVDLEWRDGALEQVKERTKQSLSADLYVDGRYSSSSTSDLRPKALEAFLKDAVDMARFLEPDPHRGLPDAARYAGRAETDLDLADESVGTMDSADRRKWVAELESMVRAEAQDLNVVSVSTTLSDGLSQSARIHSNGFVGERKSTASSLSAMLTVLDDAGRRPMGWEYTYRRHREDMDSSAWIAQRTAARARSQLGAGRIDTGKYTVVVDRQAISRLLGALLSPLSGPALQQRRSLWEGRLGDLITSPMISIYDAPHVPRGLGSSLWDADGFSTHRRPIIEDGVLSTYLIDQYYARKMSVEPTGGDTHNVMVTLGERDLDGLIADVGDGIYIERFLGGNSNQTTGDISLGCAGRVIRNGQRAEPFAEANLAGHFGQIWEGLVALGNDPNPNSSMSCPSCVFENVQISGA